MIGTVQSGMTVIGLTGTAIPAPSIRRQEKGLLLSFAKPIEVSIKGRPSELPMIDSITYGYDSLLVSTSVPAEFKVKPSGSMITIEVMPTGAGQPPEPDQAAAGRRLELARIRLLLENGKRTEARMRAAHLAEQYPRDPEVLSTLASIEADIGRTRRALELYDRALAIVPSDASLRADRARVERGIARSLSVEPRLILEEGSDREEIVYSRIQAPLNEGWRLFLGYDVDRVDVGSVTRPSGESGSFDGLRQRGEAGAVYEWEQGHTATLSLYGNADTLGIGGEFRFVEDEAVTTLSAAYHQPDWEFTELVVNNGWRDRILLGRQQRLFDWITARIAVSANQYGMDEVHDAAQSIRVEGELDIPIGGADSPYRVSYGLDAEYPGNEAQRTDSSGNRFTVLDIQRREVHSLTLGYDKTFGAGTGDRGTQTVDLYGGWAVDRFGGNGPVVGGTYTFHQSSSLDVGLLVDYIANTGRDSDTVLALGGYVTWRF